MESALDVTSMFRLLRLWKDPEPVITPQKPLPPMPMITYNKGLPSLPDDVIDEIFGLLDTESLKSCSLTGKVASRSAKPLLHRTLHLTPQHKGRDRTWPPRKAASTPGDWNEFKGLPVLAERGLLRHTRHLSVFLGRNPLFPHDLQLHVRHLQTLTNLRSLKTRWLDIPSFLPRMGEYFGAFLGSLQSLELEYPRGDNQQIIYFICQFPKLRDLRIKGIQDRAHAMHNGGPHPDADGFPPLDGTLDLEMYTGSDKSAAFFIGDLIKAPLKFRTLKLLGCTSGHSQLLIDACATSLEHIDLTWYGLGEFQCPRLSFAAQTKLRRLELRVLERASTELLAAWMFDALSTVTSNWFTEVILDIAHMSHSFRQANEGQVRGWNSVDDVLDRLSLCEDVALVVRWHHWAVDNLLKDLVEKYFPLMWENGRVVLEGWPPEPVEKPRSTQPDWRDY